MSPVAYLLALGGWVVLAGLIGFGMNDGEWDWLAGRVVAVGLAVLGVAGLTQWALA